ncbi:Gfo/Idh/MocA family protein [Geobacter sp. DSM 9736]|uniref:Gfo/Idh/MocA family protein n=1 Tax=Geobacter sp. DSM 9736 TaxID=1277350 RepID=UPI000B50C404|nr:Gfo/Idh/MocA family oxidoreductase [Geobacter sp. DSM 9736]
MIRVGIIGYGYWGPNVVRNFIGHGETQVAAICDLEHNALQRARRAHPGIHTTSDCNEILRSPDIDAVVIVTPVSTHYELAKVALENGKHIFIEKPFTASINQAEELIELADKKNLRIMVDHTFLFTGSVRKIKQLIEENVLGDLYYFDSIRINLGLFQKDVNVVWDLAPHDLSIMDHLINKKPVAIMASGTAHFHSKLEDVAYITLYFSDNLIAHINVNWLSPVKIRTTLIGGDKKMLVWNDLAPDEKIRIYDRGVETFGQEASYDMRVSYRSGDMWAPKVEQNEALKVEVDYFIDCIINGKTPINDGQAGLRIVRMLQSTIKSLKRGGEVVYL